MLIHIVIIFHWKFTKRTTTWSKWLAQRNFPLSHIFVIYCHQHIDSPWYIYLYSIFKYQVLHRIFILLYFLCPIYISGSIKFIIWICFSSFISTLIMTFPNNFRNFLIPYCDSIVVIIGWHMSLPNGPHYWFSVLYIYAYYCMIIFWSMLLSIAFMCDFIWEWDGFGLNR